MRLEKISLRGVYRGTLDAGTTKIFIVDARCSGKRDDARRQYMFSLDAKTRLDAKHKRKKKKNMIASRKMDEDAYYTSRSNLSK